MYLPLELNGQAALDELVNRDYEEEQLTYILNDLGARHRIDIRFNETLLPLGRYTYSFDQISMSDVLKIVLTDKGLDFLEYAEDRVIVIPKEVLKDSNTPAEIQQPMDLMDSSRVVFHLGEGGTIDPGGQATIKGRLVDANNFDPIPSALIRNLTTSEFVISKSSGQFEFDILPGQYVFQITSLTHETYDAVIQVRGNDEWEIPIKPENYLMDEVVISVKSSASQLKQTISGLEVLGRREIKQLSSFMGESDVVKSLLTMAGVLVSGDGASGFNVRGGSIDQNLILNDGAILFNPSHVLGFFSTFNPDIVLTTSLNKGHIPAQYGGRVSSVMDVEIRDPGSERFAAQGGIGLISSRISADIPIVKSKAALLFSGRMSYAGWMLSRVEDLDIQRSDARFNDVNIKYNHVFSEKTRLTGSFFRSYDEFLYSDEFGYSWENQIGSVRLRHLLQDNVSFSLQANVGSLSNQQFEPEGPLAFELSSGIRYWQIQAHSLISLPSHTFRAGLELINNRADAEELKPLNDSQIRASAVPKENGREAAVYINDQWTINDRLSADMGIRLSWFGQVGPASVNEYEDPYYFSTNSIAGTTTFASGELIKTYSGIEPRISLRYSLLNDLALKLSYNRTYQYIHLLSNTTTPTPVDIWQVSNKHIRPLSSHSYSLGLFKTFGQDWDMSLDGYYRSLDNTLDHKDFANLLLNQNVETGLLIGSGRSYGAELSVQKNGEKFSGRMSYSYSRSERRTDKTTRETINASEWFSSNFDQPHAIKLFVNWQISKRDRLNFNFTYTSGRPITAPIANYAVQGVVIADFSGRNAYRLPDYHRLDFSYTFTINRVRRTRYRSDLTFSLYNLYARRNAFSIFYRQQLGSTVNALRLSVIGSVIPSVTYNFQF